MQRLMTAIVLVLAWCAAPISQAAAAEQITLMGMIAKWQYPDSELHGAEMADGETVDASGNRTVQSIVCKTVMTTDASIEEVLEFYRMKLKPTPAAAGGEPKGAATGQSVVFSDDSEGRPFAMHTVIVNTDNTSTAIVITRGKDESQTHIAWKHYRRIPSGG